MLKVQGRRGVCLKSSGALEAGCRCSNEEVRRYGGGLQACRRRGICLKSSGALEMRCRCVDVEVFTSRALEALQV